jgi:hypothetical protein
MQTNNLAFVIAQAEDERQSGPIADAVRQSIEVGVVVPSILRSRLEANGLHLVQDTAALADYGFASLKALKRVLVTDHDGALVAMGAAGDHDEALLHAMLGWFRENAVGDDPVPAGLGTAPNSPSA